MIRKKFDPLIILTIAVIILFIISVIVIFKKKIISIIGDGDDNDN